MDPAMLLFPENEFFHQNHMFFIIKRIYTYKEDCFSKNPFRTIHSSEKSFGEHIVL